MQPGTVTITLREIQAQAIYRPPGYVEDILSHGVIDGDTVTFDDETYRRLVEKYRGDAGGCQGCGQ